MEYQIRPIWEIDVSNIDPHNAHILIIDTRIRTPTTTHAHIHKDNFIYKYKYKKIYIAMVNIE